MEALEAIIVAAVARGLLRIEQHLDLDPAPVRVEQGLDEPRIVEGELHRAQGATRLAEHLQHRLDAVVRLHDETMVGVRGFAAHLGMRCIGILNHLFSGLSNIAGPVGCQSSFCLMKIPMLLRPARAAQRSEAREVCRITPLARTQSERRRRLALATGFRLSDCLE